MYKNVLHRNGRKLSIKSYQLQVVDQVEHSFITISNILYIQKNYKPSF